MSQRNDPELTIEEQIQANATLLIKQVREEFGVELKYDEESVKWIEDYVERSRTTSDQETIDLLRHVHRNKPPSTAAGNNADKPLLKAG